MAITVPGSMTWRLDALMRAESANPASTAASVARGALAGMIFGVAARAWMWSLATDPQIRWWTLALVAITTVDGALAGWCHALRHRAVRGWRLRVPLTLTGVALVLSHFGGPPFGVIVMVPAGLAVGSWRWPRAIRLALAVLTAALFAGLCVLYGASADDSMKQYGPLAPLAIAAAMLLVAPMAYAFALATGSVPRRLR